MHTSRAGVKRHVLKHVSACTLYLCVNENGGKTGDNFCQSGVRFIGYLYSIW